MTGGEIGRRLVFYIGGYELVTAATVHARLQREAPRFEATWSASLSVGPLDGAGSRFETSASGPNWATDTEIRVVAWDDVIQELGRRPMGWRLARAALAFLDFVAAGALFGYLRTNWRYAAFFLFPYLLTTLFLAAALATWVAVARLLGNGPLGHVAGALVAGSLLLLSARWAGKRYYLFHLFDDWIFSRSYVRWEHPVLSPRLDRTAQDLVAAARGGLFDEVLVLGHSLGAVLAVDLLDRALARDPDLGQGPARVALLTVGSSLLKIGLHRGAARFRAALQRVALAPGLVWAEYQALSDVMNFYKSDPVTALGLRSEGRPIRRVVRLSRMLSPDRYRRIRRDFFRLHRQFVSGNDRRAAYDYVMAVCGPFSAERVARSPDGPVSLLSEIGAVAESVGGRNAPQSGAGQR